MNRRLFGMLLLAYSTSFLYGFHTAIISPALLYLPRTFPVLSPDTPAILSGLVSALLIGAMMGSLIFPRLADTHGRSITIFTIHILYLLSSLLLFFAPSVLWLFIGRLLCGFGVGGATSTIPIYVSEISPVSIRGLLGTIVQFSITSGILSAYLIGYFFSDIAGSSEYQEHQGWRYMFGFPGCLSIIYLILHPFLLLESPRWLLLKGFNTRAQEICIQCDLDPIQTPVTNSPSNTLSKLEILKMYKKEILVAVLVNAFQQLSGFNVLVYYAGIVFKGLGLSDNQALLASKYKEYDINTSSVSASPQLIALLVVSRLLDGYGRRLLLLISSLSLAVCFLGLSIMAAYQTSIYLSILIVIMARISFSIGLGPIPAIVSSEILPTNIRGFGMTLASFTNWGCNIIVTTSFVPLSQYLREKYPDFINLAYLSLSMVIFSGTAIAYYYLPETRGISLESEHYDETESGYLLQREFAD